VICSHSVWVLHYSHRHGEDIEVYATEEPAWAGATQIARGNWISMAERAELNHTAAPAAPGAMGDQEVRGAEAASVDTDQAGRAL
jgi:hypothetical protein